VLSCGFEESTTLTVRLVLSAVVGVPLMVQPAGVSVRPVGNVPAVIVQVYGVVPPVTRIVAKYAWPTVPFGRVLNDRCRPELMVRVTGPLVLSAGFELSVTLTVRFAVPGVVGVPVSVQLLGASVNPAGIVPPVTVQVYGAVPPVTPKVPLYGVPVVPLGRVGASVNGPPPPPFVMVMLIGPLVLSCGFELSVTFTLTLEIPAVVGVPLTVQPAGVSVNPAGRVPVVMVQV